MEEGFALAWADDVVEDDGVEAFVFGEFGGGPVDGGDGYGLEVWRVGGEEGGWDGDVVGDVGGLEGLVGLGCADGLRDGGVWWWCAVDGSFGVELFLDVSEEGG